MSDVVDQDGVEYAYEIMERRAKQAEDMLERVRALPERWRTKVTRGPMAAMYASAFRAAATELEATLGVTE